MNKQDLVIIDVEAVGIYERIDMFSEREQAAIKSWIAKQQEYDPYQLVGDRENVLQEIWMDKAGLSDYTTVLCMSKCTWDPISESWDAHAIKGMGLIVDQLVEVQRNNLKLVGHNIMYDLRKIAQDCIAKNYRVPEIVKRGLSAKPWEINKKDGFIFDTSLLAQKLFGRYMSLDDLCTWLKIHSPKEGIDGSKVHRTYWTEPNSITQICKYCNRDTEATAKVFTELKELL